MSFTEICICVLAQANIRPCDNDAADNDRLDII
jgi:hypothetical protein